MCRAERAESEDVVAELEFEYEELSAIVDKPKARNSEALLAQEEWSDKFSILPQNKREFFLN